MATTCPKCGLTNPPESRRCDCGYDFVTNRTGQAEPVAPYRGVGGWLLWLCLGLTVFSPALTLIMRGRSYSESAQYFGRFPGLGVIMAIDTVLSLALMVFSIYAGTQLWRVRPKAVQTAKRYFACLLAYQMITGILPFMAGLPSELNQEMLKEVVRDGARAVIGVGIWYSYLIKSRRVKATYELQGPGVV